MKLFSKIVTMAALLGGMTAGVQAQTLVIGGFQGAGDPTDTGWIDVNNSDPITSDPECSFASGVVPGYAQSLAISVPGADAGTFGYPTLELGMSPAQITAFEQNTWITFTFSVPAGTYTGGYSQIYNLVLNAPGYGYNNQSWANAIEMGNTNNTTPGTDPNYYFINGANNLETMVVSFNYSSVEAAIQAGISNSVATNGPSYLQLTFQGNQGGGAPTAPAWYLNNVVLSKNPFGAGVPAGGYMVDDFSTNGVSNTNPTNDDYFDNTNEIYLDGSITNVYGNWFGGGFTSLAWSTNNVTNAFGTANSPANGSLQLNLNPGNGQWVLHHADYSINPDVDSITYTDVEMDVMFDPSSASGVGEGSTNYGPLRIGVRPNGVFNVQDWFYYAPVITNGNNGWVHIAAPLNPVDPNQQPGNWGELLIGMDPAAINPTWTGTGNQILYIDNIVFKGPTTVKIPAPKMSIQSAVPGIRIYAGSTANTFDRGVLTSVDEEQSPVGATAGAPVSYAFSILSYPSANINQTMLELVPINTLPSGNAPYNNEDSDYEAGNGIWLLLGPLGGGKVTASLQWKTNEPDSNPGPGTLGTTNADGSAKYNPNYQAFLITNSTAIGTWLLTFNSANTGTLTPPGGAPQAFTIQDPNAAVDFANPVFAQFGLQPNSTAGEGLFETWGYIGVTNVVDGNEYEDFTHETSDLTISETTDFPTTPSGFFEDANSPNQGSTIIIRNGLDLYSVSWTTPASGFNLVTDTNLLLKPVTHWVAPTYYSSGNDATAPRGAPVLEGPNEVEILPADNLPTVNGQPGGPIAPDAYFLLMTNTPAANP